MKQLSSLEISFLASEIANLSNSKLQQVYQPTKKQLVLQFHTRGKGRTVLKVRVPTAIYLAEDKETGITGFCSLLRKKLNKTTFREITQLGFERILKLEFSSKNTHFSIILELFSKGNIIILDQGKIIAVEEAQSWSTRELKPGQEYARPPTTNDPRTIDENSLLQLLKSTNKTDIVRFLAIELSLGGLYAEELCIRSGIDKKNKPASITPETAKKLVKTLKQLLKSPPAPSVIMEDDKAVDVVPITLSYYKSKKAKKFKTFSEALETYHSTTKKKTSKHDKEITRLQAIIEQQKEAIDTAKEKIKQNSRQGELIYENYQELKNLLENVNEERKNDSWEAVKKQQKNNKKIKSIDQKTGKLTITL